MSPDQTQANVNIVYVVASVFALFFIAIDITAIVLVIYKTQYRHKRYKSSNKPEDYRETPNHHAGQKPAQPENKSSPPETDPAQQEVHPTSH